VRPCEKETDSTALLMAVSSSLSYKCFVLAMKAGMTRTFSITCLELIRISRLGILGIRLDVTILSFGPTARSDGPLDDTTINFFCVCIDTVFVKTSLLGESSSN
jgi:hypothetical protein